MRNCQHDWAYQPPFSGWTCRRCGAFGRRIAQNAADTAHCERIRAKADRVARLNAMQSGSHGDVGEVS